MRNANNHVRTHPNDFHCLGNQQAEVTAATYLPTSQQKKQISPQQDTQPGTEESYSLALFLPELHRMNYMYTGPNKHVSPELPRALCNPSEFMHDPTRIFMTSTTNVRSRQGYKLER